MNCRFCGYYYYDIREQGSICGYCGGNREGLHKTRLMIFSKLLVAAALLLPILTALLYREGVVYDICDMLGLIEWHEGDDGAGKIHWLFYFHLPPMYILGITVLLRVKRPNVLLCIFSAMILLLPAIFAPGFERGPVFILIYTIPCALFIAAAVIALIDKKKQIREYKIKRC